uniref:Uncharacterized protein n=1 Tax=Meloidogyne enterolobii TaxID=390850 RepID=A0A6V7VML2_MELEN|nr:unnamed protein product [Meloidogyne enterolobii]
MTKYKPLRGEYKNEKDYQLALEIWRCFYSNNISPNFSNNSNINNNNNNQNSDKLTTSNCIESSTHTDKTDVEFNGLKNNYGEFIATSLNTQKDTLNILSEHTTGAYPIPSQPSNSKSNSNFVPYTDHLLNSSDKYLMSSTGVTAQNEDIDMIALTDVDKHPFKPITPPKYFMRMCLLRVHHFNQHIRMILGQKF